MMLDTVLLLLCARIGLYILGVDYFDVKVAIHYLIGGLVSLDQLQAPRARLTMTCTSN